MVWVQIIHKCSMLVRSNCDKSTAKNWKIRVFCSTLGICSWFLKFLNVGATYSPTFKYAASLSAQSLTTSNHRQGWEHVLSKKQHSRDAGCSSCGIFKTIHTSIRPERVPRLQAVAPKLLFFDIFISQQYAIPTIPIECRESWTAASEQLLHFVDLFHPTVGIVSKDSASV